MLFKPGFHRTFFQSATHHRNRESSEMFVGHRQLVGESRSVSFSIVVANRIGKVTLKPSFNSLKSLV